MWKDNNMKMAANSILEVANWVMARPDTEMFLKYQHLDEENATRAFMKFVQGPIEDVVSYTGNPLPQVTYDIMHGDDDVLYGVCDRVHVAHMEMINWIKTYLDTPKSRLNNILDYYGKTGEFSFRVGKMTKCRVTYIDQDKYFNYAKFRFRLHGVHYKVKSVEATPSAPRPDLGDERYGLISMLELPLEVTPDWIEWYKERLFPYGFVATCAALPLTTDTVPGPFRKVKVLPSIGYIYQLMPETV